MERKAKGEELEYDHQTEAEERTESLENAIRHLTNVRQWRNEEAQKEIDKAVEQAERLLEEIRNILGQ